jgi:hypothetical protein
MVLKPEQTISAQVLLRAANGKRPDGRSRITAENIREWTPSAETVARVRETFLASGFEVGDLVGNSVSISGPVRLFEAVFRTPVQQSKPGVIQFLNAEQSANYELAPEKIPRDLRGLIVAITFTPPPDFGPTSFSV